MQALTRALFSWRGACSSSGQLAARSFSEAITGVPQAAAEAALRTAAGVPQAAAEAQGAKAALFRILGAAGEPLTSAQVWEAAQPEGLRSKRHTKQLLQQLNLAGSVKTVALVQAAGAKKQKSFGYRLNEFKHQQWQAAAPRRAAAVERVAARKVARAARKAKAAVRKAAKKALKAQGLA